MTKEDAQDIFICEQGLASHPFPLDDIQFKGSRVKELLRLYAKQECIAFRKWEMGTDWVECYGGGKPTMEFYSAKTDETITLEQLYFRYRKSLIKKSNNL
jgi:hypothetical protein